MASCLDSVPNRSRRAPRSNSEQEQNRKCRCYSDSRTTGSNASTASQAAATATVSTKQATVPNFVLLLAPHGSCRQDRSIERFTNATAPAFTDSSHGVQRTDGAASRFASHFQC